MTALTRAPLLVPINMPHTLIYYLIFAELAFTLASSTSKRVPASPTKKGVIRLGYLTGSQTHPQEVFYKKPGQTISGAITLATREINNDSSVLPNHTLEFIIAETYGKELESVRQTELLLRQNISAYIGPQETCVHEAKIASAFNVPMISYFCTNRDVSDKVLFPAFARTMPHDSQISMAVVSLLRKFKWKKVVFISNHEQKLLAHALLDAFQKNEIIVSLSREFQGPYFYETDVEFPFIKLVEDTFLTNRGTRNRNKEISFDNLFRITG
jgi:hypothetical protein